MKSAVFALVASVTSADEWEEWKQDYGKVYNGGSEDDYRRGVFEQNLVVAAAQNALEPLAQYGSTKFSDMTNEEFKAILLSGYVPSNETVEELEFDTTLTHSSSVDWTGKYTTAIKDQGHCGSCWAFSAISQLEADAKREHGFSGTLSTQELVDCTSDGEGSQRNGCKGGSTHTAFTVLEHLGGAAADSAYRYTGQNGHCKINHYHRLVGVKSFKGVGTGSESKMKQYVGSTGPLSVCIDAHTISHYRGGIKTTCGTSIDHCVQIVGFGSEGSTDYWKVRNSWGKDFGEHGYFRLKIGHNLCRIDHEPIAVTSTSVHAGADEVAAVAVAPQKKYARGYMPYVGNSPASTATITDEMRAAVPATLDWSSTGATTAVKDQGRCGSCWAFSATEGIESGLWMATKQIMDLATQQIVACDKSDGGCNGGNLDTAFSYVQKNGGIDVLSDYADTSSAHGDTGKCITKKKKKVVQVSSFKYAVPPCDQGACSSQHTHEGDLRAALNTFGPLSICVNAQTWDYYEGGVFKEECSGAAYEQDHCVQLVGFDTAANYWKVRNSWTTGWGEGGYIRLPMGENACGVADCAMYVTAALVDSDITV